MEVSTADVLALLAEEEKKKDKQPFDVFGELLMQGAGHLVGRGYKMFADPVQATSDRASAAAAGVASFPDDVIGIMGQELYGPETRAALDEQMAKDPISAMAAPAALPLSGAVKLATAAPKTTTAGGVLAALSGGATEAGDSDYSQRRMDAMQQQKEAFNKMQALRDQLGNIDDEVQRQLDEAEKTPAGVRALQKKIGADVDGKIGGQTRAKARDHIRKELERGSAGQLQSLQARYDTLGDEISRLDAEYSPEAVRKRQQSSRFAQLNPTAATATQAGLFGAGLFTDIVTKGRSRSAKNAAVRAANQGARKATNSAEALLSKGRVGDASVQANKAGHFAETARTAGRENPFDMPWNTIAGAEAAFLSPDVIDYARANINGSDELKNKVLDGIIGKEEERNFPGEPLAKRAVVASGAGTLLGKLARGGTGAWFGREAVDDVSPNLKAIGAQIEGKTGGQAAGLRKDVLLRERETRKALQALEPPPQRAPAPQSQAQQALPPPAPVQNPALPSVPPAQIDPQILAQARQLQQAAIQSGSKEAAQLPLEAFIAQVQARQKPRGIIDMMGD